MAKTKVLITVKTYPAISSTYEELVCTAGILENGEWIRIYPIQFRKLDFAKQYAKYDWIEIDLVKNDKDFRPESYRPYSYDSVPDVVGHIGTEKQWIHRSDWILKNVYNDLSVLISEAKTKKTSLAMFKPSKIIGFDVTPCEREWDRAKLEALKQGNIFQERNDKFEVVRKLPYEFRYIFEDCNGKRSKLLIEDWEIGALYWNCLIDANGNEDIALKKVRDRYFDEFMAKKELYLFLGTRYVEHAKNYSNPFSIIGVYYPPKIQQLSLF
ncbi:hypothetical protein EXU85_30755 [Spirosoma sp. KCTC 42546]|uniref:hypothetical protein n=1 Tax=Spirosoma sp. KCTC 42546 TaxID=2520506 RepID=UPI0011578434|nr:hypothetical protein [Spirosoma sp. KCTC 42546]QDK82753.1 hypothetical protein EXU85_30755 [Spirosoma sp. KCTC 42546]